MHAQLHLHETQLAAGVMLLKQMAAVGQQYPSHLSASLAQQELSPFILNTLWNSLHTAAQQDTLLDVRNLQLAMQHIHCCNLTHSARRYTLLAAHDLLGDISADKLSHMHTALKAVYECGSYQGTASSVYISLLRLLPTLAVHAPEAASQAAERLVLDLVKRIAKAPLLSDSQKMEIQAALHAVFSAGLPMGKHLQEYIVMELLSPDMRDEVRTELGVFAHQQDLLRRLPVLLRVGDAELTYLPVVYGHLR